MNGWDWLWAVVFTVLGTCGLRWAGLRWSTAFYLALGIMVVTLGLAYLLPT